MFVINIFILKWSGIENGFDYLWHEFNKLGLTTCLILTFSDILRNYIEERFMNPKINVFFSIIISFIVSVVVAYAECSLSIYFSLYGDLGRMLTFTPKVFFEHYIIGPYLWNIVFWFICCNIIYTLHYFAQKYSWEDKLVGKFGYVFSENVADAISKGVYL